MRRKAGLIGASLLGVTALGAVAGNLAADRAAEVSFSRIAAKSGSLSAAEINARPWRGETHLKGLAWQAPGLSVHIGSLTLAAPNPLFSFVTPAQAQAGKAGAENVTIEAGLTTYRIKRIDLSGTSLSDADLRALFDRANTAPLADRLAKLTARALTAPEIIVETKQGAATQTIIYRDVTLGDVVNGKAGVASANGVSFTINGGPDGDISGAYGRMSAKALDLVLAARVMTETRKDPSEPKKPLYESFTVDGFTLANAKIHAEINIKSLSGHDIKARALSVPPGAGRGTSSPEQGEKPGAQEGPVLAGFLSDLLDSFDIGGIEANDLKLTMVSDDHPVRIALARALISHYEGFKFGEISLEGLVLQAEASKIDLSGLTLRGLDFQTARAALANVATNHPISANASAIPNVESIALTKLDVNVPEHKTDEGALNPSIAFGLARFDLKGSNQGDGIPTQLNAAIDHLSFDLIHTEDNTLKDIAALGYAKLDLSSELALTFNAKAQELTLSNISLSGADMGTVKIAAHLDNVTKEVMSPDPNIAQAAALGAVLKRIDLRVENAGLFEKTLAAQAANQDRSIADMQQTYATAASLILPVMLDNGPAAKAIGAALAKFVADPKSLRLVAVAPSGLSVADLGLIQQPGALLQKLNVEVFADEDAPTEGKK